MKKIPYNKQLPLSDYFNQDKSLKDILFDDTDQLAGELTISFNRSDFTLADSKSNFSGSSSMIIQRVTAFISINFSNGQPTKESLNRMYFILEN
ncbi:hypothetical protein I6N95_26585 [Vagococcus sp. BWB3-3]|uniref:Uncharacterized protein n=1 Tax=Vagococcus allomyrinae TaxID=2794353 RepID=A0A940PH81_9ENTE|nr:hypothetical protein [Vagococcus allomyrinae]MBP1044582.1 hypothetical protein [Vagococcus allomyrinae]